MTLGLTKAIFLAAGIVAVYMAVNVVAHLTSCGSVCELPVVVEILNGCGRPGIAEQVASHLRGRGFDIMYVGNADDFDFIETLVVDRTGDRDKAHAVAAALGRAPVVYQISSAFFVDVTVILGGDAMSSSWLADNSGKPL
jgi:hypothetical protein